MEDLATSDALTLVEPSAVSDVLVRMQRDPDQELTPDLAREVAVRDGIKAVLEGDVGAAGTGFILSATLRAAETGETLASFRRTAETPEEVIRAIDKVSQDIREKTGESLRSIRRGVPLEQVTTTSLDALRKFSEAEKLFDAGDEAGSIALLEEAIALDSAFAMAHRKVAITLSNLGIERGREIEALEAAYRHRHRLTERERLITEATYHNGITGDQDAIVRAYEGVLRIAPEDPAALNNLANVYSARDDFERAAQLYQRAVDGAGTSNTAHSNLVRTRIQQGDLDGALQALEAFRSAHPEDPGLLDRGFWVHLFRGDWERAEAAAQALGVNPDLPPIYRVRSHEYMAQLRTLQGRIAQGRREMALAQRLAEQEFGPPAAWFYTGFQAYLEVITGHRARARAIIDALEERNLFDQIPIGVRDYSLAVVFHWEVGNIPRAQEYLRRWGEEVPPQLDTRYGPVVRRLRAVLLAAQGEESEETLSAIEAHRNLVQCRLCYQYEEAVILESTGRLKEARDLWMGMARQVHQNFTVSALDRPRAWEAVGRLSDEIGDTEGALQGYRSFVDLWADADPELQPRVEAARARIAALEAEVPSRAGGSL